MAAEGERQYFRKASGEKADMVPLDMIKHPSLRWREWVTILAGGLAITII